MTKLSFFSLVLVAGAGCAVVACSSDDDSTAPTGGSGGVSGGAGGTASAGKSGGGSSGTAGGIAGGAAGTAEGGSGGEAGQTTLYERLGSNAGITAAVAAIVTAEVKDPMIASYFSQSTKNPLYRPSVVDIEECLVLQLGSVSGGTETYPSTSASGFACEDMTTAHADLGINSGTFDQFVTIAAGVLTAAKVAPADVAKVGGVLNSTKTDIVTDTTTTAEKYCTAPAACAVAGAGGEGGAG